MATDAGPPDGHRRAMPADNILGRAAGAARSRCASLATLQRYVPAWVTAAFLVMVPLAVVTSSVPLAVRNQCYEVAGRGFGQAADAQASVLAATLRQPGLRECRC
jgi:hypothetical protein